MSAPAVQQVPVSYGDGRPQVTRRMKLWRTLFRQPRPLRRFAPKIDFDPKQHIPDLEVAAQWGEQIIIEDIATVLHRDGTSSSLRRLVTQLYGAEQLGSWDELVRSFDARRESFVVKKAKLYFPDGTWRNAENKKYTTPVPGERANNHGRTIVLRFYPLRPGVTIEYEEQYDEFRLHEFGHDVASHIYLQTGAPCLHRRFTVAIAKPFAINFQAHHGAPPPTERWDKEYHVCTWESRNVDGLEFDGWTPPMRDFAPWVDVSSASGWTPFARKLRDELEPGGRTDREVVKLAKELADNKQTPLEKASAAYAYVARTVRYGRPPTESLTRNSRSATQMFQDLRGDCKDKSALLVQLLRAMDMQANVAAVMTADEGRAPFLPSARFNHALVRLMIEGQTYWLDAANGPFGFADLPAGDQGIQALVLDHDSFHFDQIVPRGGDFRDESRECVGVIGADGSYDFEASFRFAGETGARLRWQLIDRTEEHCLTVLQSWLGNDFQGAVGDDFLYGSVEDLGGPFCFSCRAKLPRVARTIKDLVLVNIPWSSPLSMTGPISAPIRKLPLALPPSHHVYERHSLELPPGAIPYAVPDPFVRECQWSAFSLRTTVERNRLICERSFRLSGGPIPVDQFPSFQNFWRECSWADHAEIVLRTR